MKIFRALSLCLGLLGTASPGEAKNISITEFGIRPGTDEDATPAFAKALAYAEKNPGCTLELPEGTYHLKTAVGTTPAARKDDGAMHLSAANLKDFAIEGAGKGAELMLGQFAGGLFFERCQGLTLRNLTIDYTNPPFSQGEVVEVSDKDRSVVLKADPGYPLPETTEKGMFANVTNTATWLTLHRQGMELAYQGALRSRKSETQDGLVRYFYYNDNNVSKKLVGSGPLRYTRVARQAAQVLRMHFCSDVAVENVRIHAGIGFVFLGVMCENVTVRDCSLVPRPGSGRMISSCADGLHFVGGKGAYRIENNHFDSLQDDCVNIILRGNVIGATPQPNVLQLQPATLTWYEKGDTVRIYDCVGFTHSDYTVTDVKMAGNFPTPKFTLTLDRPVKEKLVFSEAPALDAPPPSPQDKPAAGTPAPSLVFNRTWNFGDVVIRKNTFLNLRARAIRLSGSGILVEDNTIDLSAFAPVEASAIMRTWRGVYDCFIDKVVIRGNTLRRAQMNGGGSGHLGAICIEVKDEGTKAPLAGCHFNEDITIENNRFDDSGRAAIEVNNAKNLRIEGNTITDPGQLIPAGKPRSGIVLFETPDAIVKDNKITGKDIDPPVLIIKPGNLAAD